VSRSLVRALLLLLGTTTTAARAHDFGALEVELGAPRGATLPITLRLDPEHLPPGVVASDLPAQERGERALHALAAGLILESGGEKLLVKGVDSAPLPAPPSASGGPLLVLELSAELTRGTESVRVRQVVDVGPFVVRAQAIEGPEAPIHWAIGGGSTPVEIRFGGPFAAPSRWETFRQYLVLGFTHILPKGLDHILFVLGLFLLAPRWKPLLWQVSAFTLAHTLTLAASIYGVVRLSPSIVEPAIALSIVWIAVENLTTSELKPWRVALVFAFGLLHGLGFAGVLAELGLPRERFLSALLSFNVGVELGQLAVLAIAFVLVGLFRDRAGYRRAVVAPASIAIAAVGLWWFVERAFLGR
jgi:hypothetical protein